MAKVMTDGLTNPLHSALGAMEGYLSIYIYLGRLLEIFRHTLYVFFVFQIGFNAEHSW